MGVVTASRLGSWLRSHGWLVAIAAAYLVFPYWAGIRSANELPRAYLVRGIVERHTFTLEDDAARWGDTGDMSPSGGHICSNQAPGMLLVVPVATR